MASVPTGGRHGKRLMLIIFVLFTIFSYRTLRSSSLNHTVSANHKDLTDGVWIQMQFGNHDLSDFESKLLHRPEAISLIEKHEAAGLAKEDVLFETLRILKEYTRADLDEIPGGVLDQQRQLWVQQYSSLADKPGTDAIYGGKLQKLVVNETYRSSAHSSALKSTMQRVAYASNEPFVYDPYPAAENAIGSVKCDGPDNQPVNNIGVFKGVPVGFPRPSFGSYQVLDMDDNLCFEREARLGSYGYGDVASWDHTNWGRLQETCAQKNAVRFTQKGEANPYTHLYDPDISIELKHGEKSKRTVNKEQRTALLLRSWTGKTYTENDILVIRSLVTELSLHTSGQYQVFLLVHDKTNNAAIWRDKSAYRRMVRGSVPPEFIDMAVLWNDAGTQATYKKLFPTVAIVHTAQWLPVQLFSQEHPEFQYVWNVELDSRLIGHYYDFLEKLAAFARKQPRRGLWERNERYYIPSLHGDYDTRFREETEAKVGYGIWGPPELPYIRPVGPKPPVEKPEDDNYQWGVGEEADMITLGPIVDAPETNWIIKDQVWGYNGTSTPRRGTIITQARVSKRLLDIMHVENLRGNHVSSEMTPQTVALHHGLKAVYAPIPVFYDRLLADEDLERWFNCGFMCGKGSENETLGSPVGWGREGRFIGSTWYYRADPPLRLYRNWMGWEDHGIGGPAWEYENGRTCLPTMLLHPVKNVVDPWSGR